MQPRHQNIDLRVRTYMQMALRNRALLPFACRYHAATYRWLHVHRALAQADTV